MASLTSIFKDVLLTNDSITVPGFGTFETSYQAAQLDEKTGVIYPPTKSVTFNASKTDDRENKLVEYLKNKLALDDNAAKAVIDEFISQANSRFADKASLTIDEVGVLSKAEDGSISLQSVPSNLSIDNYGMDTVEVEQVEEKQRIAAMATSNTVANNTKGKTSVGKNTKATTKVSTTKTTTTTTTTTTQEKKKSNKLLKVLLVLLPILAILTILFFIFKDGILAWIDNLRGEKQPVETVQVAIPDSIVNEEEPNIVGIDENSDDGDEAILSQAGFNNVSPQYLGNKYKKYYLVGGSFRDKANANKVKREINAKEILKAEGNEFYRVIIIGSDDPKEIVDAYKAALDKGIQAEDMWLLKNSK